MIDRIPWIPTKQASTYAMDLPIDRKAILNFLELEQNTDGFYNTLEELFWAVLGLKKLGVFSEKNRKKFLTYILKYRISSGGYTNKIDQQSADIWSTFYAIALFSLLDVFKNPLDEKQLYCPECGQKQVIRELTCFNCNSKLIPEKRPCVLCNRVIHSSSSNEKKWKNLCPSCHELLQEDLQYILQLQTKKGFKHCKVEKCIVCKGSPSYQSTLFAVNALYLLESTDQLNMPLLLNFLKKNQYVQELDRVFQFFTYFLLQLQEEIDYLSLITPLTTYQHESGGFGIEKKASIISDSFWCVSAFFRLKNFDKLNLGALHHFLSGLKRNDGGYSEQTMDTISNIKSTIQAYLILSMIFNPLIEQIETEILKQGLSDYKIFLTPIAKKYSVPEGLVEAVIYQMLSYDWIDGKILNQLDFFHEYLNQGNKISYDIGKSLIQIIQNQKVNELNLTEFSKRFSFENAEERVKSTLFDFISRKFIEGDIRELKKTFKRSYLITNLHLPQKFLALALDKPLPSDQYFQEKAKIPLIRDQILQQYHQLLALPSKIEAAIQAALEEKDIQRAREELNRGIVSFKEELAKLSKEIKQAPSNFNLIDFKSQMLDFYTEFPSNQTALTQFFAKFKIKQERIIAEKEKAKKHEDVLIQEQRIIENFQTDLQVVLDKLDLLTQNFTTFFQQNYSDPALSNTKIGELNQHIEGISRDFADKVTQVSESLQYSKIPESVDNLKSQIQSKIDTLKEIATEALQILETREEFVKWIEIQVQEFENQQTTDRKLVEEAIEEKQFTTASDALEKMDAHLNTFRNTVTQSLEAKIKNALKTLSHFKISFDIYRAELQERLKTLTTEWIQQKDNLLTHFHEKTELAKKTDLEKTLRTFIQNESTQFTTLKTELDTSIKHENIKEARAKLSQYITEFSQRADSFKMNFMNTVKETSRQYKTFKKLVSPIILNWEQEKNFLLQSMNALLEQITTLSIEKTKMTQVNKLDLIIKNQKLLLSKQISNLLKLYRSVIAENKLLTQEQALHSSIKDILTLLNKSHSQITTFIRENVKKYPDFSTLTSTLLETWDHLRHTIQTTIQKLQDHLTDDLLIEKVYFVIKAFEGYRSELKYLAKSVKLKLSHLKDKLVFLLSNSRLKGTLDPVQDILTLNSLEPIASTTNTFLIQIEEELGTLLQIDFVQKEALPKSIDNIKQNLLQLRYLLVIHQTVGATIFHRKFGAWEIDPDLISGFLTAIQSFSSEIKSKSVPIKKMAYKEFEILLNQGNLVYVALIVDGKGSNWHEDKLATFTKEFEVKFAPNLESWSGELTQFKEAGLMIDRIFELFRLYL
ncbi:MAG: prenyltransferase/squalene oxidase repeat-containing protein [Candidatus Helarchaeota archaeon]